MKLSNTLLPTILTLLIHHTFPTQATDVTLVIVTNSLAELTHQVNSLSGPSLLDNPNLGGQMPQYTLPSSPPSYCHILPRDVGPDAANPRDFLLAMGMEWDSRDPIMVALWRRRQLPLVIPPPPPVVVVPAPVLQRPRLSLCQRVFYRLLRVLGVDDQNDDDYWAFADVAAAPAPDPNPHAAHCAGKPDLVLKFMKEEALGAQWVMLPQDLDWLLDYSHFMFLQEDDPRYFSWADVRMISSEIFRAWPGNV